MPHYPLHMRSHEHLDSAHQSCHNILNKAPFTREGTCFTRSTPRTPLRASAQLAYVVRSFSNPYAAISPNDFISGVSGAINVARNARFVFVPKDMFASNVSAPPNTLRTASRGTLKIRYVYLLEFSTLGRTLYIPLCLRCSPLQWLLRTYQRPLSLVLKTRSTSPNCGLARPLCGGSREAEMAEKMSVFCRPYEIRRVVCSTSSRVVAPAADDEDTAGSITPARNDLRVCVAPSTRIADMMTGVFMLSRIYDHSH